MMMMQGIFGFVENARHCENVIEGFLVDGCLKVDSRPVELSRILYLSGILMTCMWSWGRQVECRAKLCRVETIDCTTLHKLGIPDQDPSLKFPRLHLFSSVY